MSRIVFMGTPGFAAEVLRAVLDWAKGHGSSVVGVFTQPDRPCGRGQVCKPCDVKLLALEEGLPVFQPENFKTPENIDLLRSLSPDFILVAAYGLILPKTVLDIPSRGCLNVHASLLPKYRGAAPIQRAIMAGETVTGVTIMHMDEGMDTGPMLLTESTPIGANEDAGSLHDRLASMGGALLIQALDGLLEDRITAIPQNNDQATYAPKLLKEEGLIDWNVPALEVHNRIRGLSPRPGTFFYWERPSDGSTMRLRLTPGRIGPILDTPTSSGIIVEEREGCLALSCADRLYLVPCIKPDSGKPLDARSFVCGYLQNCLEDEA
jgi:methionyl-tRNA formyltransferase